MAMDHEKVGQLINDAAEIQVQLTNFVASEIHDPDDDADVRRLRVSAAAMVAACDIVARMMPTSAALLMRLPAPETPATMSATVAPAAAPTAAPARATPATHAPRER
jgi:hypothetical protein